MSENPRTTEERRDPTPATQTLREVLYATKDRASTPESEWLALIQSLAGCDQLALYALYERAHRIVFKLTLRITNNRQTAEELTVDVFHDVWRNASRYDPATGSVLGWILNQARWRAIDRLRFEGRQKRLQPQDEEWRQWTAPRDSEDAIALRQRIEALRKAMAVLTPDEQQAIETAYLSGLTYSEVAERLNQPVGTIKTRIRSGFAKLRAALAGGEQP
jgi:RNA polymerase sigma-70 factor (ECF subfamily)